MTGAYKEKKYEMTLEEIRNTYRINKDLHTHTVYSQMGPYLHARGTIMQNVKAAHEQGLKELAITDHGPKEMYGLNPKRIPRMRKQIARAMKRYPDVKVYLGVEANIMDSPNGLDVAPEDAAKYDFINAGYHYGVPHCGMLLNWIAFRLPCPKTLRLYIQEQNTRLALRALSNNSIKVLTHPGDKAYFDLDALAAACEETGTLIEINARHKRPNAEDIRLMAKHDVNFIISSDAHRPAHVGRYDSSIALAMEAGLDLGRIVNVEAR